MTPTDVEYWAIVPAAGRGERLGAERPKQYLPIAGQPVLHHTLQRLAATPGLRGIVLILAPDDTHWQDDKLSLPVPLFTVAGGATRADSVLAGIRWLQQHSARPEHCWALVHDAARPGLRATDVAALMAYCRRQGEGAILALPAQDTVKESAACTAGVEPSVTATLDRGRIWLAQTPQCFPLLALGSALVAAQTAGALITDEASAMSLAGHPVGLVRGHWQNQKLTAPDDWPLIEWVLQQHD